MLAKRRPFKLGRPATGRRDSPGRGGGNKKRRGRAHEAARAPRLSLSHRRRRRATGSCVWIQAAGSATRLWREMRCLLPSAPTKNHDQQADLQFSRLAIGRPLRARSARAPQHRRLPLVMQLQQMHPCRTRHRRDQRVRRHCRPHPHAQRRSRPPSGGTRRRATARNGERSEATSNGT